MDPKWNDSYQPNVQQKGVEIKPGQVFSLTQVCEAAWGTLESSFQEECHQYRTQPWLRSCTDEPIAAASLPYFFQPAGAWCAEGRSTACSKSDQHMFL